MKKRAKLDIARQLASIPMRNTHVKQQDAEPGQIPLLDVELKYPWWMRLVGRLFRMRLRTRRRIQLDAIGWGVYEQIDGRKTFEQLVEAFAKEHNLEFLESRSLLMVHIQNMMRTGLVAVGFKTDAAKDRREG